MAVDHAVAAPVVVVGCVVVAVVVVVVGRVSAAAAVAVGCVVAVVVVAVVEHERSDLASCSNLDDLSLPVWRDSSFPVWDRCYKTFYDCNLRIFTIDCKYSQSLTE